MHARIAGMRAQRCNRAELDPLGHPGKRHGGYPGRVGAKVLAMTCEIGGFLT
jgi:hypothetical protein